MVVLDTDHVSLLEFGASNASRNLLTRLASLDDDDVFTTVVNYEEQTRGWMTQISAARTAEQQVTAYAKLRKQLDNFCRFHVLDFDRRAAEQFQDLRQARIRIGTLDLRIAAIAMTQNATLLSRNLSDFQQVPRLHVEDWTA